MRSDYGLYVVALICFIIAGAFLASAVPEYTLEQTLGQIVIAIFVILGILFAAGGYALRPKVVVKAPEAHPLPITEPSPPPTPPPPPPTEKQVPSIPTTPSPPPVEEEAPTPAPALEEPAKVEEEKPAKKPVRRRRRRKKAA